jgi:membrane protease YdiL (CAAX protease family)
MVEQRARGGKIVEQVSGSGSQRQVWMDVRYVILTYAISWLIWVPGVVWWVGSGSADLPWWLLVLGLVGAYGPSIAALILTHRDEGAPGVKQLLSGLTAWRVAPGWWAVALFFFPAMLAAAITLYHFTGGAVGDFQPGAWYFLIPIVLVTALPFGPLGEELGWRGYALPRLQARHSALTSSVIIGVLWTFWHIPLFWVPGAALGPWETVSIASVSTYLVSTIGTAIIFTWLFNNTRGSVLLAIVLHITTNASGRILFAMFPDLTEDALSSIVVLAIVIKWAVVVALVVIFGWRKLSRPVPG